MALKYFLLAFQFVKMEIKIVNFWVIFLDILDQVISILLVLIFC